MSGRFDLLPNAMQILGARSVAVFSVPPGSRVWSVAENRLPIDTDVVAATTDMVAAAQRLVELADPGSPLDEILAMDESWFHVLYFLGSQEAGPRVAHMLLDRNVANLAQARREFWALVEAEQATWGDPMPSDHRLRVTPVGSEAAPPVTTHDLPRRTATGSDGPEASSEDGAARDQPLLMDHFAGPFATDELTLRRVLDTLRRL